MTKTLKKQIKSVAGQLAMGGLIKTLGRPRPMTRFEDPTEAIFSQTDVIFEVPANKCKYTYQFSYGLEGWHPFVVTIREHMENPAITFEDSTLCRYYKTFHPATILDLFFEGVERRKFESTTLGRWPIGKQYPCLPWDPKLVPMRGEGGLSVADGLQGFGPVSDKKGRYEFGRLLETYRSIRSRGYRPTRDSDGELRGYFLRTVGDYRFLIRAGFHRTAALSALGHDCLRVKFKAHFPRVVDLRDLERWPLVRNGVIEPEVAQRIFIRFFTEDGT